MLINPEIEKTLKTLRLSGIVSGLPARVKQASDGGMSHMEFLEVLLNDELDRRRDRLLTRRINSSKVDVSKRIDNFDFGFNPKISKKNICELATVKFIMDKTNSIFIGPPGTGKSHIAHSIGLCAINAGFNVLYYQLYELLDAIIEANATDNRKLITSKLLKPDLLIIDDLGMKKLNQERSDELLEIIMKRYEKASTIMVSNRPLDDWPKILGDAATTSALLDRLMHHAYMIPFNGKSYRLHQMLVDKKKGKK